MSNDSWSAEDQTRYFFSCVCDLLEIPHDSPLNLIYEKISDLKADLWERDAIIECQLCANCDHNTMAENEELRGEIERLRERNHV